MTQIPSVPSSPRASLSMLQKLWDACEALGREQTLEAVTQRGVETLLRFWPLQSFALFQVQRLQESLDVRPEVLGDLCVTVEEIDAQTSLSIGRDLKQEELIQEASEGYSLLQYGERSFQLCVLGDLRYGAIALVWELAPEGINGELELFVRQLQLNARWASRVAEAQNLLHIDDLTGLYNHRYMELAIDREIKRSQRYESSFCLLFIDLDHFKPINDKYGHLAGSQVLREVAQILRAAVRDVDLVFRYGGDEFVVLLIESDAKAGLKTGQRIRERIQNEAFMVQTGQLARITASIGVAAFPEHATEKERLLALADEGMYESKRQGKNQVVLVGTARPLQSQNLEEEGQPWPLK